MSSSTALLPKKTEKEHPIFLRVCHSPWVSIGQKSLVILRGITLAYLYVTFFMIVNFEIRHSKRGWLTVFEFSNVAYFIQFLYQAIAYSWTFCHLHYPHANQNTAGPSRIQKMFSPPRQLINSSGKTWFSVFYYASQTFPFVSAFIYWGILNPYHKATIPADEIFKHGGYQAHYILSKYAASQFLAFVEIFFYSSIKRAHPVTAHVFGLTFLTALYISWAGVGYQVTHKYGYFFMDHRQVGWDHTFSGWAGLVALVIFFFNFVYFLTWFREGLTRKGDNTSSGYQQLPH